MSIDPPGGLADRSVDVDVLEREWLVHHQPPRIGFGGPDLKGKVGTVVRTSFAPTADPVRSPNSLAKGSDWTFLGRPGYVDPFALTLRSDPAELAGMRSRFAEWLQNAEINAEIRPALVLAVHEAAANAIEHSTGDRVEVDARIDRSSLMIEISDSGRWLPQVQSGRPDRGRGIRLIEGLVDQVEFDRGVLGTIVRIRQPV